VTESQAPDVTIGTIVAAHGIKGEVKVRIDTDFPERFDDLKAVWVQMRNAEGRIFDVESTRFQKDGVLVKFRGVDDRNTSEAMRGAELMIDRDELMELEEDQFYIDDLIGLDVYTTDGEHMGKITEVLQNAANDIYVTPRGMIPAVKQFVREVDLKARKMVVTPEGVVGNEK
jgi:16S rRNA processing protein RimM